MSMHFSSANQYNQSFNPRQLGNWQIPKWYPEAPLPRRNKTVFISNDKGHLLPGIPRSVDNPWGNYIGTWNLPTKIDRKKANELSAPNKTQVNAYKKKVERFEKVKKIRPLKQYESKPSISKDFEDLDYKGEEKRDKVAENCQCYCNECICNKNIAAVKKETEENLNESIFRTIKDEQQSELKSEISEKVKEPYVPGDLTEDHQRHSSHIVLDENRNIKTSIKTSNNGFEKIQNKPESNLKIDSPSLRASSISQNSKSSTESMNFCREHGIPKRDPREAKTILDAISNFNLAKELHKENLEHEPLPDTVPDTAFKKLQMLQSHKHPGLAIKGNNFSTAIGWKSSGGWGANRCTKLKVFRPKTCVDGYPIFDDCKRPNSVTSFDKKWRFIRQNKVSPMDLAICWDLTPVNSGDEPKPPKHIDGSNGSSAPAVFSLVSTPKDTKENDRREPASGRNMPAVFNTVEQHTDVHKVGDCIDKMRPKTTTYDHKKYQELKRAVSAYDVDKLKQSPESKLNKRSHNIHQSTPNVSTASNCKCSKNCCNKFNSRLCVACELKNLPTKEKPKEQYKMAFLAGKPNSRSSSSNSSQSNMVHVPKQKDPYRKKNYCINSLAPPFCLQKELREDYPEHWRLASVYQHSYKPIHLRKKTLLQSIYQ